MYTLSVPSKLQNMNWKTAHVPERRNMRGINKEKGLASSSQAPAWGFQITDDCLPVELCGNWQVT